MPMRNGSRLPRPLQLKDGVEADDEAAHTPDVADGIDDTGHEAAPVDAAVFDAEALAGQAEADLLLGQVARSAQAVDRDARGIAAKHAGDGFGDGMRRVGRTSRSAI